jgi:hypothetical protein
MTKLQHRMIFTILALVAITANAQERPTRTYAGGGIVFTHSTAESGQTITGAYLDTAYDLRHSFQVRFRGEYRGRPAIPALFTGDYDGLIPRSEIRYGGALIYHVRNEGQIRPFVGGGIYVTRQFFTVNRQPLNLEGPESIYDSAVNPTFVIGAGMGRRNEFSFTKYFHDTYGYSNLRGYGFDVSRVERVSGRLHLKIGARFRRWTYYQGLERYDERSSEFGGFVGFQFQ